MRKKSADQVGSVSAAVILLLAMALPGCGEKGPPTFPVQGRIVFEGEGNIFPLYDSQGGILFESVEQPGAQAYGAINEDGTFKLMTSVNGVAKEGAIAGTHRGRLVLDEEVQKFVAEQFLDLEKSGLTITVPTEGEVVVKIWP
jgi:hypothetical protein